MRAERSRGARGKQQVTPLPLSGAYDHGRSEVSGVSQRKCNALHSVSQLVTNVSHLVGFRNPRAVWVTMTTHDLRCVSLHWNKQRRDTKYMERNINFWLFFFPRYVWRWKTARGSRWWWVWSVFQVTGVFSKEYIPQGTRFGPLQGLLYTKDNVPKQANRKYFWRVRETHTHRHTHT